VLQLLLKETSEKAGAINSDIAAAKKKADEELRRSQAINQSVDMTSLPELEFPAPSPDAYKRAKWPKIPTDRLGKDLMNPGSAPTTSDTKEEEKPPQAIALADAGRSSRAPVKAANHRHRYACVVRIWADLPGDRARWISD
jgi:hypothetical protein